MQFDKMKFTDLIVCIYINIVKMKSTREWESGKNLNLFLTTYECECCCEAQSYAHINEEKKKQYGRWLFVIRASNGTMAAKYSMYINLKCTHRRHHRPGSNIQIDSMVEWREL